MCPLWNPRETHLRSCRTNHRPIVPTAAGGLRHGRWAVDQDTLLTQDIEDSFSAKKNVGAVFVDVTAAYDTLWHRGLTCKLLRLLPHRHMVHWSWRWFAIAALTLRPETAKGAGDDASRTASHRDLSWPPSFQNLNLWLPNHRLQKVWIRWWSSNHVCWWRLAGSGRGAEQGTGHRRWIPPDLEAKAQRYKNSFGSLPP